MRLGGARAGRLLATVAISVLVMGLGGCGNSPERPPVFGVNGADAVNFGRLSAPAFFRDVQDIGGNTVREQVGWDALEPQPGHWDAHQLGYLDGLVAAAPPHVRFIFAVTGSPSWARNSLQDDTYCQDAPRCSTPPAASKLAAWRDFVEAIVRRFGNHLAAVEVWNEPNFRTFWQAPVDPARWASLVISAAKGAHAVDPSIPVLTGGLSPGSPSDPNVLADPGSFLARAYQAKPGLSRYVDGIGVHPYPGQVAPDGPGSGFTSTMSAVRAARDRYDPGTPLWVTEVGYHTGGEGAVSESDQAAWLGEIYQDLAAAPDVHAILIHALIDRTWVPDPQEQSYGLIRADGTPKPAYCSFVARAGRSYAGC